MSQGNKFLALIGMTFLMAFVYFSVTGTTPDTYTTATPTPTETPAPYRGTGR
jgi:hypothetical protein